MIVTVEIDTDQPLSDKDREVLALLSDAPTATAEPQTKEQAEAPKAAAKKATGAARKTAAAAKDKPAAAEEFPTDAERADAESAAESPDAEDLRAMALKVAGDLLAEDKANETTRGRERVLSAVAEFGAERVSTVPDENLAALVDLLNTPLPEPEAE